jgi:RND family efflux transporter MFP subunit
MNNMLRFALMACGLLSSGLAVAQAPKPAAPTALSSGKSLDCLLEPSLEVKLGSPVDGIIADIRVDRGASVRRGQALVLLNSQLEAAAVESSRGKAEFAQRKAERNDELYKQQLISVQERDQLETEAKLAVLELREREAALRLRTITSPIDGVVVDRLMAPGDQVSRSGSSVLRLMRLDPLYVEVVAPAELFGRVKIGMTAQVTADGVPQEKPYVARVTVIDRVIDAASGTFRVRLELRNPNHSIPTGLRCRISNLSG